MTPDLDTRPLRRSVANRLLSSRAARLVAGIVVAVVLLIEFDRVAFVDPTFVERISFVNDGGYDIHVAVAGEGTGTLGLGTVVQHCSATFELVVDQGAEWRLEFRAQGRDGGELIVARSQLEQSNWTLRIPDAVAERLSTSGAPRPQLQTCPT